MRKAVVELAHEALRVAEDPTRNMGCIVCDAALMTDQDAFCSTECLCTFLATVCQPIVDHADETAQRQAAYAQSIADLSIERDKLIARVAAAEARRDGTEEAEKLARELIAFHEKGHGIPLELANGRWTSDMLVEVARAVITLRGGQP